MVAIGEPSKNAAPTSSPVEVTPGSPEAHLVEIAGLIAANRESAEQTGEKSTQSSGSNQSTASAAYRGRLEKVIELATKVIAATHQLPEKEQQFNNAVHYLSDARLELALGGDEIQAELLIEDAESLFARDAGSFAAAEAGFNVVELAQRMAQSLGAEDPDWLHQYANQAVQYAQRFPDQEGRAAMSLFAAGRLCDRAGQSEQALRCLQLLEERYKDSVFAEQAAGFLRRLTLPGQPLELAGPTIDGGSVEIEQYAGRVVLVVFWASTSATFQEQLPVLQQIESRFADRELNILGVNLDTDEAAVDQFLATHQITWPQVFSASPNQRGGRNPVARYYSVQVVPTFWLVDRSGTVVDAPVAATDLPGRVQKLIHSR